uniref:Uncharacterized protein n=1 Tax=Peronospora matthiolae TaxID=2874970 RepID=A0AAV1V5C6_9STRA
MTKPASLRLTTSPTLLAFRSDVMTPRRTMLLLPMMILPMMTWVATQCITRTRPTLTGPDPLQLTTLPTLLAFWSDLMTLRRTMPLLLTLTWIVTKCMTWTRPSFAQRGRELDQLKTERAISYQELQCLRSYHAAHVEELALLRAERDLLSRDRQAQLDHLVNFVMGLLPSVGLAYDKRRREQSAADPVVLS